MGENSLKEELREVFPFVIKSIRSLGPKIWDMRPNTIKNGNTLNEFKKLIKSWKPKVCPCRIREIYITQVGFICFYICKFVLIKSTSLFSCCCTAQCREVTHCIKVAYFHITLIITITCMSEQRKRYPRICMGALRKCLIGFVNDIFFFFG